MANGAPASAGTKDVRVDRMEEGLSGVATTTNLFVPAKLTTALANTTNNDLVFTAIDGGVAGNDITVAYIDPSGNDKVLSVSVTGTAIVVNLATSSIGAITSTAAQVAAAVNAKAGDFVSATNAASNNGTGVVAAFAAANLTGGTGVRTRGNFDAGIAGKVVRPTPVGVVYTDEGQGSKTQGDSVKHSQPLVW